jgi:hypothetical protein
MFDMRKHIIGFIYFRKFSSTKFNKNLNYYILAYDATQSDMWLSTFQRDLSPPFSTLQMEAMGSSGILEAMRRIGKKSKRFLQKCS